MVLWMNLKVALVTVALLFPAFISPLRSVQKAATGPFKAMARILTNLNSLPFSGEYN
jgi:hypothetical protein